MARNYRVTAQNAVEQAALQIRRDDPTLTLLQALEKAHVEMGLPPPLQANAPAPAAPPPPEPEPLSPLDQVKAKLAEIDTKLTGEKKLHPTFDADEYSQAMTERQNLLVEQMRLETDARVQEQLSAQSAAVEIARVEEQVRSEFGVLGDPNHPFTLAYEAQKQHLLANAPDDIVGSPTFELDLARQMADQFEQQYHFSVRQNGNPAAPAATTAPAPSANVTQQPAPAAAPQPQAPAAAPRSAAVPLSGAPASVNPVMGIAQPDTTAQAVQAAVQTADLTSLDALLNGHTPGGNRPGWAGDPRFHPSLVAA